MSSRNMLIVVTAAGALLALSLWLYQSRQAPARTYGGATMGTRYTLKLRDCDIHDCDALAAGVERRLDTLVMILSHYEPEAEVARFNRLADTTWFPASPELLTVVRFALDISEISNGAFDVTVGPAVNGWGFGPDVPEGVPSDVELDAMGAAIGYAQLRIRDRPPALRKTNPNVRIDLSALAKGYAVDEIALLLEDRGVMNYLVEIGGEVRTAGMRALGQPWRVGIESPDGGDAPFVVTPGKEAVATSGDYRNFFVADGRRLQHTIDPTTARPVEHGLASVSVIRPTAMEADALATLLMVLGPEAGYAYASERELPALFILRDAGGATVAAHTPAFRRYLRGEQPF